MNIALIAAMAEDGTIGHQGKIPWHISDDLKRFKQLTMGHTIIMGRKTYESIGQPLPGRTNIVLTHNRNLEVPPGVRLYPNLDLALEYCRHQHATIAFIIGGAEIYRQAIGQADTLLLTHVKKKITGDTRFPDYDRTKWIEISREETADCAFVEYARRVI
jgi:dihydrofolate reductase